MKQRASQRTPDGRVTRFGRERLTFSRRRSGRWRCNEHPEWGLLTQSQVDGKKNAQFPKRTLVKPGPKPPPPPKPRKVVLPTVRKSIIGNARCPNCYEEFWPREEGPSQCTFCKEKLIIAPYERPRY
jgi:hypothetical protein